MQFADWLRNLKPASVIGCAAAVLIMQAAPFAFADGGGFNSSYVPAEQGATNDLPPKLRGIGLTEHLGDQVDENLTFRDENGQTVALKQFFTGHKPVLLSLAYYSCPSLCNFHLNGLKDSFKQLKDPVGKEFEFVVVSIEPKETPELAAKKKAAYLEAYGRPEGNAGWHFLTGDEKNVRALANQIGFNYKWDEETKQYAHASAAFVLTPTGQISRYLYGIVFDPKVLRLSLVEASDGKIGTIVDKLNLFCFHIDPSTNKLSLAAFNVVRAGAVMVIVILAIFLIPFWYRSRSRQQDSLQGEP